MFCLETFLNCPGDPAEKIEEREQKRDPKPLFWTSTVLADPLEKRSEMCRPDKNAKGFCHALREMCSEDCLLQQEGAASLSENNNPYMRILLFRVQPYLDIDELLDIVDIMCAVLAADIGDFICRYCMKVETAGVRRARN